MPTNNKIVATINNANIIYFLIVAVCSILYAITKYEGFMLVLSLSIILLPVLLGINFGIGMKVNNFNKKQSRVYFIFHLLGLLIVVVATVLILIFAYVFIQLGDLSGLGSN
jgi:uncharacterized protein YqhQ